MNPGFANLPIPLLAGAAAFLTVAYVALLFSANQREDLRKTVETYSGEPIPERRFRPVSSGSVWERIIAPSGNKVSRLLSSLAPGEKRAQTAQKLTMAGDPIGVSTYLAIKGASLLGIPFIYLLYQVLSGQPWDGRQILTLLTAVMAGRILPDVLLRLAIARRQKAIERSIPDAVDLIVACVEAGLSLDGALMKVAERMTGPLGDEIARTLQEIRLGRLRRDALADLANRTGVRSLQNFSQAIAHAEQMGISIADVLRTLGEDLRTKRRLHAQEMAQKAPIKMIPVIVFFILPSLFVVVLGPAMISIAEIFMR